MTKEVPPYAIVGGVPARVIKFRFDAETIRDISQLEWWRHDIADFGIVDWANAPSAVASLRERIKSVPLYAPERVNCAALTPYGFWCLFHFEIGRHAIRIKLFGVWVAHIIRR